MILALPDELHHRFDSMLNWLGAAVEDAVAVTQNRVKRGKK